MAKSVNSITEEFEDIIDTSTSSTNYSYYTQSMTSPTTSTITINSGTVTGSSGSYLVSNGTSGTTAWSTQPYLTSTITNTPSITVNGNAEFDGDIKWKGRDLGKLLEKIEDRLAILTPDSKKLEQFAALKKAYDHYKLLEKLCEVDDEPKQ